MTKKNDFTQDAELFRTAIGKVRAIESNTVILKPEKKPKPAPIAKPLEQIDPLQKKLGEAVETVYQEDKLAFISPGLQKSVLKKLRKVYYGLDAEIDLHGLTSREAKKRLLYFLQHCVEHGNRCILIVHGKGSHSPENQPVLKNDINFWLRQHNDVLAFCSAPSRVGGAGAVLVLLRLSYKFGNEDVGI